MGYDIHETAVVLPGVEVGDEVSIGPLSVVGKPYRQVHGKTYEPEGHTRLGARSQIGAQVIIGAGSCLGEECIVEDGCILECEVVAGKGSHFLYRAYVCNEAEIGANCIIGGFVCERAEIAEDARVFGELVHKQVDPTAGWDDLAEESPTVEHGAFVGFGATVIGGVRIGRGAYVCAGAVVTRNVPDRHIAFGVNKTRHYSEWKGALSRSPLFQGGNSGKR